MNFMTRALIKPIAHSPRWKFNVFNRMYAGVTYKYPIISSRAVAVVHVRNFGIVERYC